MDFNRKCLTSNGTAKQLFSPKALLNVVITPLGKTLFLFIKTFDCALSLKRF